MGMGAAQDLLVLRERQRAAGLGWPSCQGLPELGLALDISTSQDCALRLPA